MENEFSGHEDQKETPISVKDWMVNLLLTYIPFVNLVMLIVWAVSKDIPVSKSNWAKARLIWMAIFIVLVFLFYGTIFAILIGSGALNNH